MKTKSDGTEVMSFGSWQSFRVIIKIVFFVYAAVNENVLF